MRDDEDDTMRTCPKCEGVGVIRGERGLGRYFVGSCDLCRSIGVVSIETFQRYRTEEAAQRRGRAP